MKRLGQNAQDCNDLYSIENPDHRIGVMCEQDRLRRLGNGDLVSVRQAVASYAANLGKSIESSLGN